MDADGEAEEGGGQPTPANLEGNVVLIFCGVGIGLFGAGIVFIVETLAKSITKSVKLIKFIKLVNLFAKMYSSGRTHKM